MTTSRTSSGSTHIAYADETRYNIGRHSGVGVISLSQNLAHSTGAHPSQKHLPDQIVDPPLIMLIPSYHRGLVLALAIPGYPQMLYQAQLNKKVAGSIPIAITSPNLRASVSASTQLLQQLLFHGTLQKPFHYPQGLLFHIPPPILLIPLDLPPQIL